ncbi:uncharacterized protein EV422DRAFT_509170 [Fimicolochytrium jonesii]|uniref:uncharacterized protein n=1 Tax=Fimicolochytrium jonesii TaxID=1396493 RepID=UPI0022FDD193|nr:uncharacterized protein EV422DRAFT_509170 [Fimicolochytrium jonesii]KAI8817131.1 hypothetical protein EV422DRAFT_509170 [Fimicolochytrium jonesii]
MSAASAAPSPLHFAFDQFVDMSYTSQLGASLGQTNGAVSTESLNGSPAAFLGNSITGQEGAQGAASVNMGSEVFSDVAMSQDLWQGWQPEMEVQQQQQHHQQQPSQQHQQQGQHHAQQHQQQHYTPSMSANDLDLQSLYSPQLQQTQYAGTNSNSPANVYANHAAAGGGTNSYDAEVNAMLTGNEQDLQKSRHQSQNGHYQQQYDTWNSPFFTALDMGSIEQTPATGLGLQPMDELELLLTPLVSPAMTPSADFQRMNLNQHSNDIFSPLTSPVIQPQMLSEYASASAFSPALEPSMHNLAQHNQYHLQQNIHPASIPPNTPNTTHIPDYYQQVPQPFLNSPALVPSAPPHTAMLGVSPALAPSDVWAEQPQATGGSGLRTPLMQPSNDPNTFSNAPTVPSMRDKTALKKQALSAPYIVPRRNSGKLISPALKPSQLQRIRSSKSPDLLVTAATTRSSPATLRSSSSPTNRLSPNALQLAPPTGAPSHQQTTHAPVFKEPYPIPPRRTSQHNEAAAATLASPALTPQLVPSADESMTPDFAGVSTTHVQFETRINEQQQQRSLAPITPAQLMRMTADPVDEGGNNKMPVSGAHKVDKVPAPVGVGLKPLLPNGNTTTTEAVQRLASKSNYQNIREGNADTIGLTYDTDLTATVEAKRDGHKQAEQRRRDVLKHGFEELKKLLPPIEEKHPSKVVVLKKSCDYIIEMQKAAQESDKLIADLRAELAAARADTS